MRQTMHSTHVMCMHVTHVTSRMSRIIAHVTSRMSCHECMLTCFDAGKCRCKMTRSKKTLTYEEDVCSYIRIDVATRVASQDHVGMSGLPACVLPVDPDRAQKRVLICLVWECSLMPNAENRPPLPQNWLQRRLGWPAGTPHDEAVLSWFVNVRKHTLTVRYKPPLP